MIPDGPLHVESLTRRERQMAQAVSRGLRNRQIALEFGISEETVKKHLATIYGKLAINGRVAAGRSRLRKVAFKVTCARHSAHHSGGYCTVAGHRQFRVERDSAPTAGLQLRC